MANETGRNATRLPTRSMWRRSIVVLVVLALLVVLLLGRLAYVQIFEHDYWSKLAVSQQLSDTPVDAARGTIYDANMTVLAESEQVWTIIMDPSNLQDFAEETKQPNIAATVADELSVLLKVDRDRLFKRATDTGSQYAVIVSKIERPLVEEFIEWVEQKGMSDKGVFRIISDYTRSYPQGSLASTVLGFCGTDYYGLYGLEAQYNDVLAGTPGRIVTAQNGVGNDMSVSLTYEKTVDAEDGNSLVLTIDSTIQHYAEKYLDQAVASFNATNRGVCIVMNVKTGAILACAVAGDYDPNDPMTIHDEHAKLELEKITDKKSEEYSNAYAAAQALQWTNKAVTDYYEPGSVFKVFTSAMAVDAGIQLSSDTFYCPGYFRLGPDTIHCHASAHGSQSFADTISHSCNPAFAKIGVAVGGSLFYKYFNGFGFTEKTGVDMLGEAAASSALYHGQNMTDIQVATSAMGQTFKITPIQMITALSAVANGGHLVQPYVVQNVLDIDGNIVSTTEPVIKRQVISTAAAAKVTDMLQFAVDGGGCKNVYVAGYQVAGKSGTADYTETKDDVWASFGAYAPGDDPEIAVLCIVDQPHAAVVYGSQVAGPVVRQVIEDTLPYLGIEPVYNEKELANLSTSTPNVSDKSVETAISMIQNAGLDYTRVGDGSTVLAQVPTAGATIPKEGTVVLYTDENALDRTTTVPNFVGMTLTQASAAAHAADLNLVISGLSVDSGTAVCSSQSIGSGANAPLGTVINLSFVYQDADD
ncbi:MAG: PASTA domain-containing protein [Clostridia bacterium]|nr:PASTA domain-containing protein [Clostridia bacterium]